MLFPPFFVRPLLVFSFIIFTFTSSANDDLIPYEKMVKDGEFKGLVKAFKGIDKDSYTPTHYQLYVSSLLNIDLDDAEEAAEQAIVKYNDNADMYLLHASVMGEQAQDSVFSALGYAEKALNSLEKAATLKPQDGKYLQALMSFHLMAPSIAGGDKDTALELAKEISAIDELRGISAFSNYYSSIDEADKAFIKIEEGIQKFPNEISLYTQLASLYVRDKKHQKAIDVYLRATVIDINKPSEDDLLQENVNDNYERDLSMLYNSHYQVGRITLESKTRMLEGINNLKKYITYYQSATIDLNGLPSVDWAYLRKSALLLENNQLVEAQEALAMVQNKENDRMEKIYNKLNKKIKREIKRKS